MTCDGKLERVMVLEKGFAWNRETYGSLSQIAKAMTGTNWNGHRFFGLRMEKSGPAAGAGRRERIGNAGAPPDAASIGPISDRVIRCGDASLARASTREIAMLHRRDGATIGDLTAAAGWLSHTTRERSRVCASRGSQIRVGGLRPSLWQATTGRRITNEPSKDAAGWANVEIVDYHKGT
jgi:Protein of unknown function (DUF2924)